MTQPLPKVTPYLLRHADTMCARRLRLTFQALKGNGGAFLRGRVRDALVEDARAAHHELGVPNPAAFFVREELVPEERDVYRRAADGYLELFGDEPARAIDHEPYDGPVESPSRQVRVGGWIDLAVEGPSGTRELRQFELWGREPHADPLHPDATAILTAVLRLSRWIGDGPVRIRHADLLGRRVNEHVVDAGRDLPDLRARFEQRLAKIRLRAADGRAQPGQECASCAFLAGCEAHR